MKEYECYKSIVEEFKFYLETNTAYQCEIIDCQYPLEVVITGKDQISFDDVQDPEVVKFVFRNDDIVLESKSGIKFRKSILSKIYKYIEKINFQFLKSIEQTSFNNEIFVPLCLADSEQPKAE